MGGVSSDFVAARGLAEWGVVGGVVVGRRFLDFGSVWWCIFKFLGCEWVAQWLVDHLQILSLPGVGELQMLG